ncbi:MAG TPA: phage terminase small subunit P27 family [Egibacteraceae bacterium]|nr:phage terminase small subunit P27 family [Egibacteraceae bacterium]
MLEGSRPRPAAPNLGGGLGTPAAPKWLPRVGKAEWRRIVRACAGHPTWLQEVDVALLTAYCATWATYLDAARDVAERGALVSGRSSADKGALVKNPAAQIARDSATQLRNLARELGFSPDARGRVDLGQREAPSRDDLLSDPCRPLS